MLKHPFLDEPYLPEVQHWLGGIDVYDREETLGEELWGYNPNLVSDREKIIKKYILVQRPLYTYRHRYLLVKKLEEALRSKVFDFASLFDSDGDDDYTGLAWRSNDLDDPRVFFEDIYRLASYIWKKDLDKASSENQDEW